MTLHEILSTYWKYTSFRPLQEDIINAILQGNDALALLPTGGGKSLCFQVPALAKPGICVVVSPLIALMKDQVEQLQQKGIKALAITSAMSKKEIDVALDNCIYGDYKFIYISPERINTELFRVRLKKMNVNLIAVDEAHCISQWGYDFRPAYLKIVQLRELLPQVPLLALTATATSNVVTDIQEKLLFRKKNVFRTSFERTNLAYTVIKEQDKLSRLVKICVNLKGSGIVYVRNRKKTQEIAAYLNAKNISADYYHAGLTAALRDKKQNNWIKNFTRVIVCTNAFGMGIDKPDVQFVIHLDLPDCLESYFQEAGRAGRNEQKAYAVLLFEPSDIDELKRTTEANFPSVEDIKKVYQAIANYYQIPVGGGVGQNFNFNINIICNTYNLAAITVYNALKFLEREGYLILTDAFFQPSRLHINASKETLYNFEVQNPYYEKCIKVLLRSYTGIFDGFVKINEFDIAKRANIKRDELIKQLKHLQQQQILDYLPQTELPQLLFTERRIDAKDLSFAPENYSLRKRTALLRMEQMVAYVTGFERCRSEALLHYFGETNTHHCGVCDVCLNQHKLALTTLEFERIAQEIDVVLKNNPLTIHQLVDALLHYPSNKVITVIQWQLDNGKITIDNNKIIVH